jgi:hypothetical protein
MYLAVPTQYFECALGMKESGEQCTVVFTLNVTDRLANECVGGGVAPPLTCSVTINAKTTVHCSPGSSMALGVSLDALGD